MIKFIGAAPSMVAQSSIVYRSKKFAAQQLDFIDSFKPIYYFLRILGLMPFSITRSSNGNISEPKVKKSNGLWFLFSICIYSMASFISFEYVKFNRESNAYLYMMVLSQNLLLTTGLICCVLFVAMDMCNRFKLVDILQKFMIFDKEVSDFVPILIHLAQYFRILYEISINFRYHHWELISILKNNINTPVYLL